MFLINRPLPLPFESLEGYEYRLGKANHYDDKYWLPSMLPILPALSLNSLSNEQIFLKLADLTLLDIDSLVAMTLHRFVPYFYSADIIPNLPHLSKRSPISLWEISKRNFVSSIRDQDKICSLCLQEYGTYFLPWLLRPVTACIVHKTVLIDVCSQCGTMLRVAAQKCLSCGSRVDTLPPPYLTDPIEIKYTEIVWASIGFGDAPCGLIASATNGIGQFEIRPPHFFEFVWRMGMLLVAYDKENQYFNAMNLQPHKGGRTLLVTSKAHDMRLVMVAAFQILSSWPESWYTALDRIAWQEHRRKSGSPQSLPKSAFPFKLKKFFAEPEWDWLLEAFVTWMAENIVVNHNLIQWVAFLEKSPYKNFINGSVVKSKSSLCRDFGIDMRKVNRAVEEGFISAISTEEKTGRQMHIKELLRPEDLEKLREEIGSFVTMTEALEYVGLSDGRDMLALSKKGLLPERRKNVVGLQNFSWQYKKNELEAALEAIIGHLPRRSLPIADQDALSLLAGLQAVGQTGIGLPDILIAVRDGKLKAFYDLQKQGLKGLWFQKEDIEKFRFACSHAEGYAIYPASRVNRILKCDYKTLRVYWQAKVLIPVVGNIENDEVTWKYDSRDVAQFQDEYVTSDKAAEIVGVSRYILVSWIVKGWLPAVTGRKIDASRRYRVNKQMLIEWKSKWIDSREVMELLGISRSKLEKWIKSGKITPIKDMGGHPFWFIREEVIRLKQGIEAEQALRGEEKPEDFYSKTQIRKYLGVAAEMVDALSDYKWFPPPEKFWIGPKLYTWRFRREKVETALENFMRPLPLANRLALSRENLISFTDLGGWNIKIKLELIQAVERNEIKAYRDPSGRGLQALLFHKKDISSFRRQLVS